MTTRNKIEDRIDGIVKAMGAPWVVVDHKRDSATIRERIGRTDKGEGYYLFLQEGGWKNAGRISVYGNFHLGKERKYIDVRRSFPCDEITVSASKTDAQIAKDILRRIVPTYDLAYSEAMRLVDSENAYADSIERMRGKVAKILRIENPPKDARYNSGRDRTAMWGHHDSLYGEIRVSPESVRVSLDIQEEDLESFAVWFHAHNGKG